MGRFREERPKARAFGWGHFVVVAVSGDLDANRGKELRHCVLGIQGAQPVILDLWDVPQCDPAGLGAVRDVKQLLEQRGWAFAVVADPLGPCATALESDSDPIRTYPDRRTARAALQYSGL